MFRVTLPYLIFLVKPSIFFMFSQKKKNNNTCNNNKINKKKIGVTGIKFLCLVLGQADMGKQQFDQDLHCLPFYQYF